MWFIACLFAIKVIDAIHDFIEKKDKKLGWLFVITIIALSLVLTNQWLSIKRPIIWYIIAYPFFWFGKMFRSFEWPSEFLSLSNISSAWMKRVLVAIAFVCLPIAFVMINGRVDMFYCYFGNNGFLYYVFGIVASLAAMVFFKTFLDKENKLITTFSKGAIMIVALHRLLLWPFEVYNDILVVRLLVPLVVCILFYYPIVWTMRYVPFALGNRK